MSCILGFEEESLGCKGLGDEFEVAYVWIHVTPHTAFPVFSGVTHHTTTQHSHHSSGSCRLRHTVHWNNFANPTCDHISDNFTCDTPSNPRSNLVTSGCKVGPMLDDDAWCIFHRFRRKSFVVGLCVGAGSRQMCDLNYKLKFKLVPDQNFVWQSRGRLRCWLLSLSFVAGTKLHNTNLVYEHFFSTMM